LEIVRAVKMVLNSKVGINYLIEDGKSFVSDLAYGKTEYSTSYTNSG